MFRVLTSSDQVLTQHGLRLALNFTRATLATEPEAGSVASGQDAFSTKEKAEEARWARRFEAEQAAKRQAAHNISGQSGQQSEDFQGSTQQKSVRNDSRDSVQQRLADLEAEKRRIEQEIAELGRQ